MAAHQARPSLGFSRQEHWSGLPFPSPMHESEKWKWSHSVMSDSSRPHGLQPTGSSVRGIFQARVLEWGAIAFLSSTKHLDSWDHHSHSCPVWQHQTFPLLGGLITIHPAISELSSTQVMLRCKKIRSTWVVVRIALIYESKHLL